MKCEHCKQREANVRYTEIINGVKKEMRLCDKCSKELGIGSMDFNMPINFSNYLGEFFNEYNNFMPLLNKPEELKCDKCNMTYDDFISEGKFGCSNCYEVFSQNIDPILKRLHGSNRYVGRKLLKQENIDEKNIAIKDESKEKLNKNEVMLKELKQKIKQLIKEEKYEEAAKVRDEINELTKKEED